MRVNPEHPESFFSACSQIGVNRAYAIARRVKPADVKTYRALDTLRRAHPGTPIRVLHDYLKRGFDAAGIALCCATARDYGIPHRWLVDANLGARTPATLALTYRFERELKRAPALWESDLLAYPDFLNEARRRGLKRALRGNGEWTTQVLERWAVRQRGSHRANAPATGDPEPKAAPPSPLISRPRPENPRELRFWVAWRIVRRMWAGRQFGAANVNPEDQRARNLPSDLIGLFDEAFAALVKDSVILTRGGIYVRSSLNPEKLGIIHAIRNYQIPPDTALARWVERA
ncbi:hypothetical protein HYW17_00650 [Candidatus Uhrbacteria bacterium]|nr:hypothetical protein [Candidatus Uhrbacteria bacterium]